MPQPAHSEIAAMERGELAGRRRQLVKSIEQGLRAKFGPVAAEQMIPDVRGCEDVAKLEQAMGELWTAEDAQVIQRISA